MSSRLRKRRCAVPPGVEINETEEIVIGNRAAIILDFESDTDLGRFRLIRLYTVDEKTSWIVTCTVSIGPPAPEDIETCNFVVRTFRILE